MCDCCGKENMLDLKIFKVDKNLPDLEKIDKGDWIDLRVSKIYRYIESIGKIEQKWDEKKQVLLEEGSHYFFDLGIVCQLPEGYEMHLLPRSSTFKNYGLLLTNSEGILDYSYRGMGDHVMASFCCMKDSLISQYDRIVQFKLEKNMPKLNIEYIDKIEDESRGGFGSTGKK